MIYNSTHKSSFWEAKPFWCQPWSILLTGVSIFAISLWWPSRIWFTAILTIIILIWWFLFLFIAPIQYFDEKEQIEKIDF